MADTEFDDPARPALIKEIYTLFTRDRHRISISRLSSAFLWLADSENLQRIIDDLKAQPSDNEDITRHERVNLLELVFSDPKYLQDNILKPWLLLPTGQNPFPLQLQISTTPRPGRDRTLQYTAYMRDKCCIVTRLPYEPVLKGVHIYPHSMIDSCSDRSQLWRYLEIFWSQASIDAWKAALNTDSRTEVLQNIITMSPTVHELWDKCAFALKPIDLSPNGKRLRLEFYWLRSGSSKGPLLNLSELLRKPELASDDGPYHANLHDNFDHTPVASGKVITLTTHDPQGSPLPSFELLQLQWHLNRLAAMMGGAWYYEELIDDDDDYGDDDWGIPVSSSDPSKIFSRSPLKRALSESESEVETLEEESVDFEKQATREC